MYIFTMTKQSHRFLVLLVFGCVLYVDCFPKSDTRFEKIVGGWYPNSPVPYHAAIIKGNDTFCGGTIIGPRHILTAAHCCVGLKGEYRHFQGVSVGVLTKNEVLTNKKAMYRIERVFIHEDFERIAHKSSPYDIAIIELAKTIKLNKRSVYPIEMAEADNLSYENNVIFVTGFGYKDTNMTLPSGLKAGVFKVVPKNQCKIISSSQMCISGIWGTSTACNGDSGGPVVSKNRLIGVLIGAIKGPNITCGYGSLNNIVKVSSFLPWINCLKSMKHCPKAKMVYP